MSLSVRLSRERLVTDAETLQEILHRYFAIRHPDFTQPAFDTLLGITDQINIAVLVFLTRRQVMHNAIPLSLAALIAVGIMVIGCFYLVSPERILGTFGLKPPASDADTRA